MISKKAYELLKKKFYNTSSWAVYAPRIDKPKSNIGNLDVFEDPNLLDILNPDYVFVGLNLGGNEVNLDVDPWRNFHSWGSYDNDYKYRVLFEGTEFWGSYMTDIIKYHANSNGEDVMRFLRSHPEVEKQNVDLFREEIGYLGTHPTLVAMGQKAYDVLCRNLKAEYRIIKTKHASSHISAEEYRDDTLRILRSSL